MKIEFKPFSNGGWPMLKPMLVRNKIPFVSSYQKTMPKEAWDGTIETVSQYAQPQFTSLDSAIKYFRNDEMLILENEKSPDVDVKLFGRLSRNWEWLHCPRIHHVRDYRKTKNGNWVLK